MDVLHVKCGFGKRIMQEMQLIRTRIIMSHGCRSIMPEQVIDCDTQGTKGKGERGRYS